MCVRVCVWGGGGVKHNMNLISAISLTCSVPNGPFMVHFMYE